VFRLCCLQGHPFLFIRNLFRRAAPNRAALSSVETPRTFIYSSKSITPCLLLHSWQPTTKLSKFKAPPSPLLPRLRRHTFSRKVFYSPSIAWAPYPPDDSSAIQRTCSPFARLRLCSSSTLVEIAQQSVFQLVAQSVRVELRPFQAASLAEASEARQIPTCAAQHRLVHCSTHCHRHMHVRSQIHIASVWFPWYSQLK
jgi:hypothetical protein